MLDVAADQGRTGRKSRLSMDRSTQNRGTSEVRSAHRFDTAPLAAWMAREVDGFAGPLRVEQFKGGQSNPTYKLVTPTRNYVLRRKPPESSPRSRPRHGLARPGGLGSTGSMSILPRSHSHAPIGNMSLW